MAFKQIYVQVDGTNTTLSIFVGWAKAISDTIRSFGWVQTADTGQVNWGTITTIPTSVQAYEIWQSGDALTSTCPIFMKILYGAETVGTGGPFFSVQFGTGSNGAGTLLQAGAVINLTNSTVTGNNQSYECDFSGTTGRFTCQLFRGFNTQGCFVNVERSHDTNGNDTGSYFTAVTVFRGVCTQQTFYPAPMPPFPAEAALLSVQTTNSVGSLPLTPASVGVSSVWPIAGTFGNPLLGLVTLKLNDWGDDMLFPVSLYGLNLTYLSMKSLGTVALQSGTPVIVGMLAQ